jgi:hypothetical protein
MEPRYSALYGAVEQLADDRRRELQASARPRRTATRTRRRSRPARRWLAETIGLRPATRPAAAEPCAPRSA